ncbi:TMEM175 family protein [Microbacterium sp. MPKO10]|uniref:TMEM175 family protein n=1 Tax=Microbacterium sp. MPKO10 TaxID=2989818 RepID=UPI002235E698|nr:TMEM175 family protein [Microbacterium sp. MPKO10]MCW4459243.1 TMEM175 family protein [Microbacterium sp. MPKO10]
MATRKSPERLAAFTDAIVAIAITLLILPLVDAASDEINEGSTFGAFFNEHFGQIGTFLISFAVIARLWVGHHRIFEHLRSYSPRILMFTILWSLTIVIMPLPTAMTANFALEPGVIGFYIATMAASSLMLTLLVLVIRGSASEDPDDRLPLHVLVNSGGTTLLFVLAGILGVVFPTVNYYALFILVLSWPLNVIVVRRVHDRPADSNSRAPRHGA